MLLSLFKLRSLLDGNLRLRTACDLEPVDRSAFEASSPRGFFLPELELLTATLPEAIRSCGSEMQTQEVPFADELKKGRQSADEANASEDGD